MEPTTNPQQPNNSAEAPLVGTPPGSDPVVAQPSPVPAPTSEPVSVSAPETVIASETTAASSPVVTSVSAAETTVPETVTEPVAPIVNGVASAASPTIPAGGKKKWLVPAAVTVGLAALIGGGYVFGIYLPNRPDVVLKNSVERSGTAADKLVAYAQGYKSPQGSAMAGTFSVKSSEVSVDATLKGEADASNADVVVDMDIAGQKANLDFRTIKTAQSDNPDLYLKASGVKSLLEQAGGAELAKLDSQWIVIDHTLLDTLQKQLESSAGSSLGSLTGSPTSEQLNDAMGKAQAVNKDYIFSTSKDKAVLTYKSFVGKETKNGRSVNHYKVGYDKAHLKEYVDNMGKALDASKLNEWAKKQSSSKNISETMQLSDLKKSIDKSKGDETFDLYVDNATKLVQSVVFKMKGSDPATLTLAQNYTGGDTYPFEVSVATTGDSKTNFTLGLTTNTKTDKLGLTIKGDSNSVGSAMSLDMKADITPSSKKVTVTTPTGAKNIVDVMKQLGIDPAMLNSTTTPSAQRNLTGV